MRIWVVFTAVLLAVIVGITTLYHLTVLRADRVNRLGDLAVVHEAMMSAADYRDVPEEIQNMRESYHFKIENGEITNIGRQHSHNGAPPVMPEHLIQEHLKKYAQGEMKSEKIITTLNKITFLAVISSTDNGYFVSYAPHFSDDSILRALFIIGAIFVIMGFFIARVVAAYLARPLSQLENFTKRIAAKNWGEPINVKSRDEIGRLAASMNKMQEDLKRADEEERLFLQSISHDLKTPVMVIMSHADAIMDGVYIDTPENTAKIIKDEAISLSKKIKQLLYFNTLSYSLDNQSENEPLRLDNIVSDLLTRLRHVGDGLILPPVLEPTDIVADREKITVALENVLDNALRYAEDEIKITLVNRVLEIYNSGQNIPEENLERIFDNMYKDKTGNFGLGLAITKKIIVHYGGTICAVNREHGVSFVIDFTNSPT